MSRLAAVLSLLLSAALAQAETKIPPIWPRIEGVFPAGGQRGTEVRITLTGKNLQNAREILFKSPKLRAKVVSSGAYEVTALVNIDKDTEPGRHDLRLVASDGSAIGYFDVGTFAERTEKEPNNDAAHAEALQFPALVNGILKAADYDYYKFDARAGETLTFDVLATRNGSTADAVLSLLDKNGEELAYSDDYYAFKDPHLAYKFQAPDTYFLRVYGSSEAGCETCTYRLFAGEMPFVDVALPAGGKRGGTVELTLRGVNLQTLKTVALGDGLARGEVLSAGSNEARVRMAIPDSVPLGEYRLHAEGAMESVPFVVSNYAEITVSGNQARSRRDPVPVTLPTVVNGIVDSPKAADYFVFRIDQPKTVVLDAHSMQLGFLLDPLVAIYDENGKRLAYQDDPTTNTGKEPANMDPHLVFTLPKAGRYTAMVRDAEFRGDPTFLYRLTMKEAEPDFAIRIVGTDETLYRGRTNEVRVIVRRLEGWNAPVEVWAENLPPGVHVKPMTADTKNSAYTGTCGETHYLDGTNLDMQLVVDRDAPLSLSEIRFRGRGIFQGKTVERTGQARYFKARIRHIGDAEQEDLRAVVAEAPGVVLDVPRNLSLKNNAASFTAIVTRLDEGNKEPVELSLEAVTDGLKMEPLTVPVASTRAEIKLRGVEKAPDEFVLVARVGGSVIGKSHPIKVRNSS
ncbi:MAG: PPC domain-containing protein [Bryobacteraceae bacterium]